jgi:hypothetical protein
VNAKKSGQTLHLDKRLAAGVSFVYPPSRISPHRQAALGSSPPRLAGRWPRPLPTMRQPLGDPVAPSTGRRPPVSSPPQRDTALSAGRLPFSSRRAPVSSPPHRAWRQAPPLLTAPGAGLLPSPPCHCTSLSTALPFARGASPGARGADFGLPVGWPRQVSHPILQGKPNASHMCARINLHTHDRQNESNTIAVIKRSRVKPVRYPLLHPERWTRRSEHNDN